MYLKVKKKNTNPKKEPRTFSLNEQTANQNKKANAKKSTSKRNYQNALSNV